MSGEMPNTVPEVNSLSRQLSPEAANLPVLPGGQGTKGSGMSVHQIREVKELTPLAEVPSPGNSKESAH